MAFSNQAIVPYYECDQTGKMKLSAAIRFMQHTAGMHIEALGISTYELYENKMVFLLAKTFLKVNRLPNAGEKVTVTTAPTHCKGAKFYRDIVITGEEGDLCVSFMTIWMLVNPESRKILRPAAFPYELPFEDSLVKGIVAEDKMSKVDDNVPALLRMQPVEYSMLDNNGHVNNSFYVEYVCNMLDYDELIQKGIDSLMISYQSEAIHGDQLEIKGYKLDENIYYFSGTKSGCPCFETQLELKNG